MAEVASQATSLVEVLCLLVFFGRLMHFAKITHHNVFWKDTKNICIMVAILLSLTDLVIYAALRIYNIKSVRWSRIVRPIFLINFAESRQVRNGFNGNSCLWTACCFLRTKGM
ncbi:hypothetical protein CIB84_007182 [Bambusicola thoracicus]|uniref:Uncharacterized protein n=1 Tax=Bambusicola thoracicus TaxID=9083 RepID=A0A2P4SYB4_BAMTH|nr:hypothetical protein CIB84_007182 [Bambusicola thoracicus]